MENNELKEKMADVKPGPWDSESAGFGPIISPTAKERILELIKIGKNHTKNVMIIP